MQSDAETDSDTYGRPPSPFPPHPKLLVPSPVGVEGHSVNGTKVTLDSANLLFKDLECAEGNGAKGNTG